MKFLCSKKDLTDALQIVSKAIAAKSQTPILSGVYLKAEGSVLELQATNFEIGISTRMSVNTEIPGEVVVGGKYMLEIVRKLSSEIVTISHDEEHHVVNISSGSATFKLLSMPPSDYPKLKMPEIYSSFSLNAKLLSALIKKTVYACSVEEVRPIFTGACLEINGHSITMSATNTHRIAIMSETIEQELDNMTFVIPAKTLSELLKLLEASEPNTAVKIDCSSKNISFTFDNVFITTRLIDGQFPPYDKVIPKTSETVATVNVKALTEVVDRIALISKETQYNTIRFVLTHDGITLSSDSPDVGEAEEKIEAKVEGPDLDISFNVKYILDALKVTDSKECVIKFNKPLSPIDYREKDNDNFIYIVTPVRTS